MKSEHWSEQSIANQKQALLIQLREELNEMNHGQYGRDGETCPAQRFLDDENSGEVDWDYCECPLAQVNQVLVENKEVGE